MKVRALSPVRVAVLGGALTGVALDLVLSPAEPTQVVPALAAGCGLLVWLQRARRGYDTRRDWPVLQLALVTNLLIFALPGAPGTAFIVVAALLGLGVLIAVVLLHLRKGR